MTGQRLRLYAVLAACVFVSGAVGALLARYLTPPQFAAVAVLWAVAGALAWWKWGSTAAARWRLRRAWAGLEGFQWRILFVLIAVALAMAVIATVVGDQSWDAGLMNLATEFAGAAATYWLLQQVLGRRATKEELIAQMGSGVRDVAVSALEELHRRGWLADGSLEGADLADCNLEGARLWNANLRCANLLEANLKKTYLNQVNLEQASLFGAKLRGAVLVASNLQEACLIAADLEESKLLGANLREADLRGARLKASNLDSADLGQAILAPASLKAASVTTAQLAQVKSLAGVTLPDGTKLSEGNWEAEFEEWRKKQEEQNEVDEQDQDSQSQSH